MPPKLAAPTTERVVPYYVRKTRGTRVSPSAQPDRPAGDYVPTAASKRIRNMKKHAAEWASYYTSSIDKADHVDLSVLAKCDIFTRRSAKN